MQNDNDFFKFLINKSIIWIYKNREFYREKAKELDKNLIKKLESYFSKDILLNARVYIADSMPKFDFLDEYGFTDFTRKILKLEYKKCTLFLDTLIISKKALDEYESLVFYLLVHSTSYKILGIEEFIKKYIKQALIENYNLSHINIESKARELSQRFINKEIFDVSKELEKFFKNN